MNKKLCHVFDFAVTDRAAFSLLPHLHGALVAAAQVEAIVVNEHAVLRVHHAEAAQTQVAVVDVFRLRVWRRSLFRQRVWRGRSLFWQRVWRQGRSILRLRVREWRRPNVQQRRLHQLCLRLHLTFLQQRKLFNTCQNSLAVSFIIRILLDLRRCLTGGVVALRVEAPWRSRWRRSCQTSFLGGRWRQQLLTRILARTESRVFPVEGVGALETEDILTIHILNYLIFYLIS